MLIFTSRSHRSFPESKSLNSHEVKRLSKISATVIREWVFVAICASLNLVQPNHLTAVLGQRWPVGSGGVWVLWWKERPLWVTDPPLLPTTSMSNNALFTAATTLAFSIVACNNWSQQKKITASKDLHGKTKQLLHVLCFHFEPASH